MVKALAALVDAICVPANARESLTSLLFFMRYMRRGFDCFRLLGGILKAK